MRRSKEDVIEALKDVKRRNKKCAVLIGAGCSVSAGVPTAQELVKKIEESYPRAYGRAKKKSYPECMLELTIDQQRDLINPYLENSKVNWAHIALAQLMSSGYVDRVLTTNFDSLMVRASTLIGRIPAVYDFATSEHFRPEKIRGEAVFHLHGQYAGFIQINTLEKSIERAELYKTVIEDTGRNRVWLIVGYSGESDPVFEQLSIIPQFDNGLFWVGYLDSEPTQQVRERLLGETKYAYYVNGFDADDFFVTVARELGCFPPDFVRKPFTYLENMLADLSPYKIANYGPKINFLEHTQRFVRNAINLFEPVHADVLEAWGDFLSGDFEKVIALEEKYSHWMPPEIREIISLSYLKQGDQLIDQALNESENAIGDDYLKFS